MEIKELQVEELENRQVELASMETDNASTEELENRASEFEAIKAELEARKEAAKAAEETRHAIANGKGEIKEEHKEEKPMEEIRNSVEYINAYANFIRTGDSRECRSLLTVNAGVSGTLPVPEFLQAMIETAWERDEILSRVNRTFIKGNLKIPFELSADGAYVHAEGTTAPTEEALTFGLVTLTPETIKKWVSFSDEVVDMKGEEFLRYVYDELTYRISKKLAEECLDDITQASASSGSSAIGVPQVTAEPSVIAIPQAVANLGEDARDLVVIMNRLTETNFLTAYANGNFAVDPFAGLPRIYSSHLPAYDSADGNAIYAIVGDLKGMQVNFPNGDGVVIKYDELTKKKEDIVEVLGRQYAGHGITKLGRFVNLKKPQAVTT